MNRKKTGALRASKFGLGHLAGVALLAMGRIDEAMLRMMPRGLDAGNGNRRHPRSRHMPHQGNREIARRAQQIASGRLEVSRG